MEHHGIAAGSLCRAIAFAAALSATSPAFAQLAGTANLGGPQPMVSTPIPDGDFAAVAKSWDWWKAPSRRAS